MADYPNPQIRLWTPAELQAAIDGDPWLGTLLLNADTFGEDEIRAYNRLPERHSYIVALAEGESDFEKIKAVNDTSAIRFAQAQWSDIESIEEVMTVRTYRTVAIPQSEGAS